MSEGLPIGPSSPKQQKAVETFEKVQVMVLGGAVFGGKSMLGTMMSIPYTDDPNSRIAVFRTSLEDMKKGGSIIDTFSSVYDKVRDYVELDIGGNPPVGKIVSGPGAGPRRGKGCRIEFIPMPRDDSTESIRGAQFSLAMVEEAIPNFSQYQLEFIMSRLRSESRHESKMLITCNPSPDHIICDWIKDYYLDEDGYAIDQRCGDIRYFLKKDGEYVWGNSREEVAEAIGKDPKDEDEMKKILSFSFVQLTMHDNPIGMKSNPGYVAFLEGLDPVSKARNLYGNWFIRAEGSGVFKREWIRGDKGERVKTLIDLPENCIAMRGVDKAYSVPNDENANPDYTSISPLMLKDQEGFYWILGNYHPRIIDEKPFNKQDKPYLGRFRKLAGERDNLIAIQMKSDILLQDSYKYQTPKVVLAKESAGAGADFYSTVDRMLEEGIKVEKDQTIGNVKGKKMQDFLAFCKACELGMVFIVEDSFEQDSLEGWYKELEVFDGTRSGRYRKDDAVDSTSIAFNALASARRPYRTPLVGTPRGETASAAYLKQMRT